MSKTNLIHAIKLQYFIAPILLLLPLHNMANQQTNTSINSPAKVQTQAIKGNVEDKQALRELLNKFTTLKADFSQTITDMQGNELQQSTGKISLQKPQQLSWAVNSPDESLLIADGNTVYNIDPFTEQLTLLDQAELTNSNPLMLLITNDVKQWDQVHVTKHKNNYNVVSLLASSPITALTLSFSPKGKLQNIHSVDRQQQQNNLVFSNVKYNAKLAANLFSYQAPDTWVVDDQRSVK